MASMASSVSSSYQQFDSHIHSIVTGDEVDAIPSSDATIIRDAMRSVFSLSPRLFQIRAIHSLAFLHHDVVVLRKTGKGKTIISLAVSLMRRGVSIFMVPLVSLGVDQASKCYYPAGGIESYLLDENKSSNFVTL